MAKTTFAWTKAALGPFSAELLAPARAARVTLGVALPLIVGWQSGHLADGAFMALGALPAGIVSFQGATRSRVSAVVVASIGMAFATFIGAVAAASAPWSLVPLVALQGYLTGLSVCLGLRWSVAVLQWTVALLIAAGLPQGPSEAALRAGLVLAGGLLQTLLVAASWTLRPGRSERAVLAASFHSLAKYASDVAQGVSELPPHTLVSARTAVEDPNPLLARKLQLLHIDLVEEAERIRASLAALAVQVRQHGGDVGGLRDFMEQAAAVLRQLAAMLASARADREILLRLGQRIANLSIAENAVWRWSGEALLGQFRAAARMIADLDAAPAPLAESKAAITKASVHRRGAFASSLATLRANMTTTSEAGRHALRLAVVAALMEVFVQTTGLYQGRWATLTIFLVLKPDYASTLYRGFQRALGTAAGAAAGALVVLFAHHSDGASVAAASAAIAIAYAVFEASYLLFSVFLTMFIVVLLVMIGMPAVSTAEARIYETFIGAAAALAAYTIWPTWERTTAAETFARFVDALGEYATGLFGCLAHPASVESGELRALQLAARRARSEAEAAAIRLAAEPASDQFSPETALLVMAPLGRLTHAELAVHALILARDARSTATRVSPETAAHVDDLRTAVRSALSGIALGLRTRRAPAPMPALRLTYGELSGDPTIRISPFLGIVDQVIDATNTLDAVVRDRVRSDPATAGAGQA